MLPKQVHDLTEGFMRAYDSEHPAVIEFRKARNTVLRAQLASGLGWGSGAIIQIGRHVTEHLEQRTRFGWEKIQEIVSSTVTDFYPELNSDLKALIAGYLSASRQAAERFMQEIYQEARAPSGYMMQAQMGFNNILPKINAEIDLFCAKHAAQTKQVAQGANQVINIQTVYGQVGNITKSQVEIADNSGKAQPSKAIGVSSAEPSSSVKLEVTASLAMESTDTRHGLLTIKALNTGTKVARIRRVAVLLVPEPQTIGGSTLTPYSSELNIGQKQAVVQIEGDDDMHEWRQVLKFRPHFEVHERAGERYGKGYFELTSGKKVEFEFLLLPDSAWSFLTAAIAPVFGNKQGHRCSRCGFVFLKQADATTVTCPRCKQVDDLKPKL